ncbi:hypothetical protein PSTG_17495 [Puccinia striiformis f. sp. tritici PST-78]|uniref:Glycoside hydrolase 131 catalytic N-terminal domain-containing protein n=2 Tax=Puccinia striiformis TaxID=27350 RepID=A0A0L0UQ56_9BASI|nr:hypothetical protein PSTG_17495 [Puccinia striiformis f. sp. tritici PST-78]
MPNPQGFGTAAQRRPQGFGTAAQGQPQGFGTAAQGQPQAGFNPTAQRSPQGFGAAARQAQPGSNFGMNGASGTGAQQAQPGSNLGTNGATGPPSLSNRIFDFQLTNNMRGTDLDNSSSALKRLITYIVKGAASASQYVGIAPGRSAPELQVRIRDDSIFVPGGNAANAQNGFRRTDVLPAINKANAFNGITTWFQTIRLDSSAPLVLNHGYLLASIEIPVSDHVWDIFTGSDFDSQNTAHAASRNSQTIRVRDLRTNTLFSVPLQYNQAFNFAITTDWSANTLTVYASVGNQPLRKVAGPTPNDPKLASSQAVQNGEYHLQLIKFPLPDANVPLAQRSDVPHFGFQEPIKQESVFFSNVFITSGGQH